MAKTTLSRPITVTDIKECLGESTLNVGKLCTSDKISAWAKYKPNRVSGNPPVTPDGWWQGEHNTANDCGFKIPLYSLSTGALNNTYLKGSFTEDGTNGWEYQKPTGSYYKRMLDFDGYYHLAAPPFSLISDKIYAYEGDESVSVIPAVRAYQGDDVLKIKDFAFAAGTPYYLGAFLVGTVNGTTYYKRHISTYEVTADNSGEIGSGGNIPTLPIADLPVGEYTIYMVIANRSIGYDANGNEDTDQSVAVLPCPCVPPITLSILEATDPYTLVVSYTRTAISGSVCPSFKFTNNTIYPVTIKDVRVCVIVDNNWDNKVNESDWISSREVAAGSTYTPTGIDASLALFTTTGMQRVGVELTVVDRVGAETVLRGTSAVIFQPNLTINQI